jgi:hypothetical protein
VISRFAPPSPTVDSTDYTTVSAIRTMELLLGLPPMNENDAVAPVMAPLLAGQGDAPPFTADRRNLDNGLVYQVNADDANGGTASLELDFRHADQADPAVLNRILWADRYPDRPYPGDRPQNR